MVSFSAIAAFKAALYMLLVSSVTALVPGTPSGTSGSAVLRPGDKVKLTWDEPAGFTSTTISLFSGPTYDAYNPNWKMDIQDISKNVDLTAKQSIEWTVPSVSPCQQIYYLLYWNAGQEVRYSDRFAICKGDQTPDAVAADGQYKNGYRIQADPTVSPGGGQQNLKGGNGTDSTNIVPMQTKSASETESQSGAKKGPSGRGSSSYSSTTTVVVTGSSTSGDDLEETATGSLATTDEDGEDSSVTSSSIGLVDSDSSSAMSTGSSTMLALSIGFFAALASVVL